MSVESSVDRPPDHIHELDGSQTQIHEMDGAAEVQGLLAGVQYLDTMSARALHGSSSPSSSTTPSVSGSSFAKPLPKPPRDFDFTSQHTFRFLDAAISQDAREDWRPSPPYPGPYKTTLKRSNATAGYGPYGYANNAELKESLEREWRSKDPVLTGLSLAEPSSDADLPADVSLNSGSSDSSSDYDEPLTKPKRKRQRKTRKASKKAPKPNNSENREPSIDQWITLWKLRSDLRNLYARLMDATNDPSFPRANKVRRLYKDATHMLQIGLSTFLGILKGNVPTTLQKVLAFVFVSKIMWDTVNQNKRLGTDDPRRNPLDEIHLWRKAIYDSRDRLVLDRAVDDMWLNPKGSSTPDDASGILLPGLNARDQVLIIDNSSDPDISADPSLFDMPGGCLFDFLELDNPDPSSALPGSSLFDTLPGLEHDASDSQTHMLLQSFQSNVGQLLTETSTTDNLRFADFLNIPGLEEILPPSTVPPILTQGPSIYAPPPGDMPFDCHIWEPLLGTIDPQAVLAPDPALSDTPGVSGLSGSPRSGYTQSSSGGRGLGRPILATCLIGTLLFKAVMVFLRCK